MNMNKTLLTTILGLASFVCCEGGRAETFTFDVGRGVGDYLDFSKHRSNRPYILIDEDKDGNLLTFRSEEGVGAGDLAIFQPPGASPSLAREVEVVLRTEGQVTFGLFSRTSSWEEPAYLVFFSPDPDGTARLSLVKTPLTLSQKIREGAVANKNAKGVYTEGSWYALRSRMNDAGANAVEWTAELVDLADNRVVLAVSGMDNSDVITKAGLLALRFYCSKGGSIQIKSITVSD